MGSPAIRVGAVVLVKFPFSDLSGAKFRPAIVLSGVSRGDWILCQITSKSYSDSQAIPIMQTDFQEGSLDRESFARPGKLFTANETIVTRVVGYLAHEKFKEIRQWVVRLFDPDKTG